MKTFILIQPGRDVTRSLSLPPCWSGCNGRADWSFVPVFEIHWSVKRRLDGSVSGHVVLQAGRYAWTDSDRLNPFYTHLSLSFSGAANAHALKSHSHQPCLVLSMSYLNIFMSCKAFFSDVWCYIILYCLCVVSLVMNYWLLVKLKMKILVNRLSPQALNKRSYISSVV